MRSAWRPPYRTVHVRIIYFNLSDGVISAADEKHAGEVLCSPDTGRDHGNLAVEVEAIAPPRWLVCWS
jgi:hypothetical protein